MSILAAGINFGKPNTEIIVESDESGVVQSCRNVDTGVEYVGGSSDFSTANVMITGALPVFGAPFILESALYGAKATGDSVLSGSYDFVLYKGKCTIEIDTDGFEGTLSVTGDIELDDTIIIITGDGTITILED